MLEVLITLISDALKKIVDTSVDKVASQVSEKRSLAIALLELYDSTVRLEESSRATLELFQSYHDGTAVPLRTKARTAMDSLVKSVEGFDAKLRVVYSKLHLYNPYLATILVDRAWSKFQTLEVVSVLLAATPRIKLTGKYPTDDVIIPTVMPALSNTAYTVESRPDSDRQIAEVKKRIDKSLKKKDVNFLRHKEMTIILKSGELNLKRIEDARRDLAEFIKQNVPLSEILTA